MYREATCGDCKRVYQLICEMARKELPFDRFSAIFQEQISSGRYDCLICERDGKAVGVLNLRFEKQLHHCEAIAEIMEFAVDAAYRGQEIGKKMLAIAREVAKKHGCAQIEAACNQLRADTHWFYEREGMRNFHFKFSKSLAGDGAAGNAIGK